MKNQEFYDKLKKLIKGFATKGYVFSNEQDFQFEMALALKDSSVFPEVVDVKLESVSLSIPWSNAELCAKNNQNITKDKKEYHDLLVKIKEDNKDKYIAIELKYKCPYRICFYKNTINGEVVTFRQGAYDEGAYAFIEDISRLENINYRHTPTQKIRKYKANNIDVDVCYAILLTNDWNYRGNAFDRKRLGKHSPYMNYSIKHNNHIVGKLLFTDTPDPDEYNKRNAIELIKGYDLAWEDYGLLGCDKWDDKKSYQPDFSFLIVEVEPQ